MTLSRCGNECKDLSELREEVRRIRKELDKRTSDISMLLRRRGFRIFKKEPLTDLLIPPDRFLDDYYREMHKYSFRLFLRDIIKHQNIFSINDVTRYATAEVTKKYISYAEKIKLVKKNADGHQLARRPITSFGATLEWYVAEIFKRDLGADAVWGVKFKRPSVGGDYDVIAKLDGALVYVEVKSAPPKQVDVNEVTAFLDRVGDLAPEVSIFLMDTELRMKDKLVPMFEAELRKRYEVPPKVVRMRRELFQIHNRIFIVNAKESIVQNLENVLRWHHQHTKVLLPIESGNDNG